MKSHHDHPLINQVDSFLISQKPLGNFFSQNKYLAESKHPTDSVSNIFSFPSEEALQKISKILPFNCNSIRKDENTNIKAVILVVLKIAFQSSEQSFENQFLELLSAYQNSIISIKNHKYQGITISNLIRVVNGFLKTLRNKKLRNPEQFQLLKELEQLPIILDYLVLFIRHILINFNIEKADDFNYSLQTLKIYQILSEFFSLNLLCKEEFYFFEESKNFIYEDSEGEFIFGQYETQDRSIPQFSCEQGSQMNLQKFEKDYNLKILQCSMQSGSNLVSSRHDSTPHFTNFNENDAKFRIIDLKSDLKVPENSKSSNHFNKGQDSNSSAGFEVNIYSQSSLKFFNFKYHKNQNSNIKNTMQSKRSSNSRQKSDNSQGQNNSLHQDSIEKPSFLSGNHLQNLLSKQMTFSQTVLPKGYEGLQKQSQQSNHQTLQDQISSHLKQNTFVWQNDQNRLRRVVTICYKTCTTCFRRFPKNQLSSNVFQVKIENQPLPSVPQQKQKTFFSKKFHKRSADTIIQIRRISDPQIHKIQPVIPVQQPKIISKPIFNAEKKFFPIKLLDKPSKLSVENKSMRNVKGPSVSPLKKNGGQPKASSSNKILRCTTDQVQSPKSKTNFENSSFKPFCPFSKDLANLSQNPNTSQKIKGEKQFLNFKSPKGKDIEISYALPGKVKSGAQLKSSRKLPTESQNPLKFLRKQSLLTEIKTVL